MATDNNDILMDADGDDLVINGDYAVGDGTGEDCLVIIKMNKNECKIDPLIGPNIITMMNSTVTNVEVKQNILINLKMDGKEPTKLSVDNGNINFEI